MALLAEERHRFKSGRYCVDMVFILRQVLEKSISAYLFFVDLKKVFDIVQLLYSRDISVNITQTIKDAY